MGAYAELPESKGLNWTIRVADLEDAVWIGKRLRRADIKEATHLGVSPPEAAIRTLLEARRAYCLLVDGYPCALFGTEDSGAIWLFSTDQIKEIPLRDLVRVAPSWVRALWRDLGHRTMFNWIHEENTVHIRFVEFLGATVYAPRNGRRYFELKGD